MQGSRDVIGKLVTRDHSEALSETEKGLDNIGEGAFHAEHMPKSRHSALMMNVDSNKVAIFRDL